VEEKVYRYKGEGAGLVCALCHFGLHPLHFGTRPVDWFGLVRATCFTFVGIRNEQWEMAKSYRAELGKALQVPAGQG